MRASVLVACAVASLWGVLGLPAAANDGMQIGKIDRTYLRVAPGLFIERSLMPRARGLETWAEVRLPAQGPDDRPYEMARVENDRAQFGPGDVVEVRLSPHSALTAGAYAEPSQVLRLVARARDPEPALALGLQPASVAGLTPAFCTVPREALGRRSEGHTVRLREATGPTAWLGSAGALARPGSGEPD